MTTRSVFRTNSYSRSWITSFRVRSKSSRLTRALPSQFRSCGKLLVNNQPPQLRGRFSISNRRSYGDGGSKGARGIHRGPTRNLHLRERNPLECGQKEVVSHS